MGNSNKKQNILIIMCWLIYVASYVSRYSYNANIVAIKDYYGVTNADTGLVGTCFFFAYGAGQIINGLLCKKYNKKLLLSIPLFLSGIINIIVFFLPPFFIYKYLWLLNGASVSVLWCLLVLMLSQNLDENHLSKSILVMSSTVAVGTAITYGFGSLVNLFNGFKYSFLLGFIVPIVMGIVWLFSCDKLTCKKVSLDESVESNDKHKTKLSKYFILVFVLLGVFICVNNLVKDGLTTWVPQILKDNYGFSDSLSIILTLVLPIVGLFGSATIIFFDKLLKNELILSGLVFAVISISVISIALLLKTPLVVLIIILFGLVSLVTYGLNSYITGVFPLKNRDIINSGFSAGILNGCAYVGSVVSAYGLGLISDSIGWTGMFYVLFGLCVVMIVICLVTFVVSKIKK